MFLQDNLQVCLYGLSVRYPHHILDIGPAAFELQDIEKQGWTVDELIEVLRESAPNLLHQAVKMNLDYCECAIHLPERSETGPLFWIHCMGNIPSHHADIEQWRKQRHTVQTS